MGTVNSTFKKLGYFLSVILYDFAFLKIGCMLAKLYMMLKMLQQDKVVNVPAPGIMHIGINDTVKSNTPEAEDIPELVVRFTPSAISNKALENVAIHKIVFANNMPEIEFITDLWTNIKMQDLRLPLHDLLKVTDRNFVMMILDSALFMLIKLDKNVLIFNAEIKIFLFFSQFLVKIDSPCLYNSRRLYG